MVKVRSKIVLLIIIIILYKSSRIISRIEGDRYTLLCSYGVGLANLMKPTLLCYFSEANYKYSPWQKNSQNCTI